MMQALYAMRETLAALREQTEREIGNRATGVAACEVLDGLDRRMRKFTDVLPPDAPNTKSFIMNHSEDVMGLIGLTATIGSRLRSSVTGQSATCISMTERGLCPPMN
ncbi:hypothetical protein CCUG62472_02450 [Mycobacteroides salmoniphilum]|nr:hypothetical protein CCUG62472_02450 [Mycobacteroides salmoniphilum]